MKQAIILHGRPTIKEYLEDDFPSPSNAHWLPWLQQQLLRNGFLAQTPEVFKPYKPIYKDWAEAIEYFNPGEETLLVGHSCGAGMIVQWLSRNKDKKVGKVILVAPWIDVEKDDWPAFDFEIDPHVVSRTDGIIIFHCTEDGPEMQSSVKELRAKLKGIKYREFTGKGHFTHGSMPDDTFPEILAEAVA